jgi:hypothetical protein
MTLELAQGALELAALVRVRHDSLALVAALGALGTWPNRKEL